MNCHDTETHILSRASEGYWQGRGMSSRQLTERKALMDLHPVTIWKKEASTSVPRIPRESAKISEAVEP
jgi:hypothetical protein